MLDKRTNVLLTQNDYNALHTLATRRGKTVGMLIREAVRKTYNLKQPNTTQETLNTMQTIARSIDGKGITHTQLINDGRKY